MADQDALPEDGLTDEQMDQLSSQSNAQPQGAVPGANEDEGLTDEQMDQLAAGTPASTSSPIGAATRSFVRGLIPNTAAGLAGNVAGVAAGAALSETGPGAVVGGLAAAGTVAAGVGYAATRAQNEILKKLGLDVEPQETADVTQHPYASEIGNLVAMAAAFNVGGIETKLASRMIAGGVMGGIDLAQQVNAKGVNNVDPTEAAIAAGGGAMFGGVRKWAQPTEVVGTQLGNAIRGRPPATVQQGGVAGRPNQPQQPDAKAMRAETDNANDLTPVAPGIAQENIAETHQPNTVQPDKDPPATIEVTRSDTNYKKGKTIETQGVEGAPTTEGITFDAGPAADVAAALSGEQPSQITQAVQQAAPQPPPQAPIETGINRRIQQLPITWRERRGVQPMLRAQQGQLGEAFQPEPPEIVNNPLAAPGRPPAKQGEVRDVQLIRHGATDLNNDDISVDRLRGWKDIPLSDEGVAEANRVGEQIAKSDTPPDNIFTSDLDRAHETAKIVSGHTNVPITEATQVLRPWNVGDLAGTKSKDGVPILADYAENHPNDVIPNGESFNQFRERFFSGLADILGKSQGRTALVLHHRNERLMQAWKAAGYPEDGSIDLKTFNQKGEPTATMQDMQVPLDRVRAAAQALKREVNQPVQQPATPPAESVEATPREQQILDSLKNLEGGEEAGNVLAKTTGAQRQAAFEKAAQLIKNAPEKREKVGEVQTGGGARGQRKTAAADAVKSAYEQFKPGEDEDDQALLDRLQKAVDHASEKYGGKNPVDRKEGYAPRVKPPEWQFIKKAQQLLARPSDTAINQFRTDEDLLRSGGAADVQATKRIEADIEKKQQPTAEVAEQAHAAETTEQAPRHDFEMMEPWKPGADESKQYIDQSNDLRNWINNLDEPDYRAVEAAYPDMAQTVTTAGDPQRLKLQMESDLEGAQQRRSELERPVPQKAPVSTVGERPLVTEPGTAASAGTSRRDLIAEYNARLKAGQLPSGNKLSPEERLAAERKAQAGNEAPLAPEEPEPGIKEEQREISPVSGADEGESAESTLSKFMSDQSGAVNLGSIKGSLTGFKNWLQGSTAAPKSEHFMAAAPKSAIESASRDSAEQLHVMTQRLNDYKLQLLNEAKKIPETFTAKDQLDMYRAMGPTGKVSSLSPQQQAFVRDVLEPIRAQNRVMYDALRKFDPELPPSQLDHVPRRIAGESEFDEKSGQSGDPIEGIKRVLGTEPPSLKDRNYMALEDANGKRFVAEPYEAGKIKVWQGGKFKIYKAPGFDTTVGKQIDVGGKPYTIQDAAANEISRNALLNGKPVTYHENAFALLANESARLFEALQNVKFLDDIKKDPRFVYDPKTGVGGATDNFDLGKELGWKESAMPQMEGWYMSPPYRHVFDDYAKPGLKGGATLDKIRTLGQAVTKTMFWLPTAHLDNVFQHWIVARGSNWMTLNGMARLAKTLPDAMKSVYMQDATQSALRGVGQDRAAGTVYGGVITKDFNARLAEAAMMDMYKNPSKWDPIIRPLGIPLPEFAKAVYRTSSKIMWAGNDMLLTQLYLENKANGMSHDKAIVEAEKHFPNYRLPSTIMGSRALQEVVADPVTVMFGRYHYGMINSFAHVAKDLLGPGSTPAERGEAMAKVALLGLMGFIGYPLMNKMAQYVTGNKDATMQPRGPMAIPMHVVKALKGEEGMESTFGALASTPPLLSTAWETLHNTDWRGKKIIEPADMAQLGSPRSTVGQRLKAAGRIAVQEGEHAARGMVSPVNTAELIAARPQSAVSSLATQLADIKNPTPAATRYINKLPGTLQRQRESRYRKPPGMGEALYNKIVGQ